MHLRTMFALQKVMWDHGNRSGKVYIETTVPVEQLPHSRAGLTDRRRRRVTACQRHAARPSIESVMRAKPAKPRDQAKPAYQFWDRRDQFDLFISELVLTECAAGDPDAASKRLAALQQTSPPPGVLGCLLDITAYSIELAKDLVNAGIVPAKASEDALHISIATVHSSLITHSRRLTPLSLSVAIRIDITISPPPTPPQINASNNDANPVFERSARKAAQALQLHLSPLTELGEQGNRNNERTRIQSRVIAKGGTYPVI